MSYYYIIVSQSKPKRESQKKAPESNKDMEISDSCELELPADGLDEVPMEMEIYE